MSYWDRKHNHEPRGKFVRWHPDKTFADARVGELAHHNPLCSGHSLLENGDILSVGGHRSDTLVYGSSADHVYVVRLDGRDGVDWLRREGTLKLRWYPSVVTLANGDAFINGGTAPRERDPWFGMATEYEFFRASDEPGGLGHLQRWREGGWHFPQDEPACVPPPEGDRFCMIGGRSVAGLYPHLTVLPQPAATQREALAKPGLLFTLTEQYARVYDPLTNTIVGRKVDMGGFRTWPASAAVCPLPIDIDAEGSGPQRISVLVAGGSCSGLADSRAPAWPFADVVDYDVATGLLRYDEPVAGAAPLAPVDPSRRARLTYPRFMPDAVLLPDGVVALVGGSSLGYSNDNHGRLGPVELIRSTDAGLKVLPGAPSLFHRGYHASAILIRDGRVLVAGGTLGWRQPLDEVLELEAYEPPNVLRGERPVIRAVTVVAATDNAPRTAPWSTPLPFAAYGDKIVAEVTGPGSTRLVLMRASSVTHSLNTDQRLLRLTARRQPDNRLSAVTPWNPTYAPPGLYRLFAVAGDEDKESVSTGVDIFLGFSAEQRAALRRLNGPT